MNSATTGRFNFGEEEIKQAVENGTIEEVVLPQFIYQKDYASSNDFTNQIARVELFFQYLEAHATYGVEVRAYYASLNVSGYLEMFKNLLCLFQELKIENKTEARIQLSNFEFMHPMVNLNYIQKLCVNQLIPT